jgi:hypothetical protein
VSRRLVEFEGEKRAALPLDRQNLLQDVVGKGWREVNLEIIGTTLDSHRMKR